MHATFVLIALCGSVALLLWGVKTVRAGVSLALGTRLRRVVASSSRNRLSAFATGLGVAALLQSSTATALIVGSFAAQRLILLPAALAVMLGADVGSTLAAQVLAFDVKWVWALLITGGLALHGREGDVPRGVGDALLGIGLVMLGLQELGQAAVALQSSPLVQSVLAAVGDEPVVAILLAGLLTWAAHSSLAIVLFLMSLATAGAISMEVAITLVLGANIGGAFAAYAALSRAPPAAWRVPLGNLILRTLVAVAAIPLVPAVADLAATSGASPAVAIAVVHTGFNLAVAVLGLPLVGPLARGLARLGSDARADGGGIAPRHLDSSVLDAPTEALACAMRESLLLADRVTEMLAGTLPALTNNDMRLVRSVAEVDDEIDALHKAIKLYLVAAHRANLSDDERRRLREIMDFTTNLEHVGDVIDKSLMHLAAKKSKQQLSFSTEGMDEIKAFHEHVMRTMRTALNVFATRDTSLARQLFADKSSTRIAERRATESHFDRLRSGRPETIETSAIHLDVLRDLKRIHGHLTAVAYPILEAEGALAESRLIQPGDAAVASAAGALSDRIESSGR
jgi:phosphate:Na+ symporter